MFCFIALYITLFTVGSNYNLWVLQRTKNFCLAVDALSTCLWLQIYVHTGCICDLLFSTTGGDFLIIIHSHLHLGGGIDH